LDAVGSADNSYMYRVMVKAMRNQGVALMNLMDVERKIERAHMSPLGNFGVGGTVDTYA